MACIFFDCDSTLVKVEGIDELARLRGCRDQVAELTERSLSGAMDLAEAIRVRFDMVRPDAGNLALLGKIYQENLLAGALEAVSVLRAAGHEIAIVSGGPQQSVELLGEALGIDANRVRGFPVVLAEDGSYAGIDEKSPLLAVDGKAVLCRDLCPSGNGVMIGDSFTDAAAKESGFKFIQFAGVHDRPLAAAKADARITDEDLRSVSQKVAQMLS